MSLFAEEMTDDEARLLENFVQDNIRAEGLLSITAGNNVGGCYTSSSSCAMIGFPSCELVLRKCPSMKLNYATYSKDKKDIVLAFTYEDKEWYMFADAKEVY